MKKAKKLKKLPKITVGPFKKVTYYQADIEGPDRWLEEIVNVGRQVITDKEYLNIGFTHIVTNMIDNKFELSSLYKPSVGTVVAEKNRQTKKPKGILVDPPSGWQYGFPARYIKEEHGTMEDFLRLKKYPEKDIAFAMQNMRHIGDEET